MGRPALGNRTQMNVRVPTDLVDRIDAARGKTARDTWVMKACELALRDVAKLVDPDLRQPVHKHAYVTLVGSRMTREGRFRIKGCTCGATEEVQV